VIDGLKVSPVDMLGTGDASGEYDYCISHRASYVRTIHDIDTLFNNNAGNRRILEIGSFLGTVSIPLKKLGYDVCAADIPEYHQSPSLRDLYEKNGIRFSAVNLRSRQLPYEANFFDAVIICEVIEHLNFNPLPVLREINRVMKNGGYIYIGMPNQASIINRIKLLRGESVHNPISDYFKQLDKNENMPVGLHWREYTLRETTEMIEQMGFRTVKHCYPYYPEDKGDVKLNIMGRLVYKLMEIVPSFRLGQVVIGEKVSEPAFDFWITEANS
jgi:SAM-dependent methyltransferase